ncbi:MULTISPECIES: mechanosensitive ion channel family protein [Maribacter]|uniref:mechanosensitive ion channel family protein n=1 Tax=Maribacter TaxID=252356 RepID=UPI0007199981|nr:MULTISPECIES: mechanosensitive ion channel domain-containing protein [Maribacter]KSA14644.1 Potassium efflux system KefA protein / Small-conductance mechanosensitive channel [Maribacter dokdonensis DSW-8]MBU2899747.1 mechanosensitive ion channel [Maribacter dokdonensis]PHN93982.1 mechanosensitive ion channel protein MscS [Maribacter sp. 6B07]|tara:strand:- start:1376 stop:2308 length:933 start_codon:yes stop_codon:yes gene_type:complete
MQEGTEKIKEIIEDDVWGTIKKFLDLGYQFGDGEKSIHITVGLLLLLTVAFLLTSTVLQAIRRFFTRKMEMDDKLKFISIFKFIKYLVYVVVILFTMSAAGIDITILITASAALFVGLGLALQEIFQDIIGGIFIIVDKSLRVGDIIEIDNKVGKVFEIKLRTTRAITRDDKVIIIPNHKFISDIVYNYTQNHKTTRELVRVGVAYGSDIDLVTKILLDVIKGQRSILKSPKPFVIFEDFGDSALVFAVNFYITDSFTDPKIKSEVRYKIDAEFRKHNISIPFPQRDVHLYQQAPFQHSNVSNTNSDDKA